MPDLHHDMAEAGGVFQRQRRIDLAQPCRIESDVLVVIVHDDVLEAGIERDRFQHRHQVGVVQIVARDLFEVGVQVLPEALGRRRPFGARGNHGRKDRQPVAREIEHDGLLVGIVLVDRTDREPGAAGDRQRGGAGGAVLARQGQRGAENAVDHLGRPSLARLLAWFEGGLRPCLAAPVRRPFYGSPALAHPILCGDTAC